MRTVWIFGVIIGVPLSYLFLHSLGFRLNKQVVELQETRQRCEEVCDSLQAALSGLSSKYRIEREALVMGLAPGVGRRSAAPPAVAASPNAAPKGDAGRPALTASKRRTGSASKMPSRAGAKTPASTKLARHEAQTQAGGM